MLSIHLPLLLRLHLHLRRQFFCMMHATMTRRRLLRSRQRSLSRDTHLNQLDVIGASWSFPMMAVIFSSVPTVVLGTLYLMPLMALCDGSVLKTVGPELRVVPPPARKEALQARETPAFRLMADTYSADAAEPQSWFGTYTHRKIPTRYCGPRRSFRDLARLPWSDTTQNTTYCVRPTRI